MSTDCEIEHPEKLNFISYLKNAVQMLSVECKTLSAITVLAVYPVSELA